MKQKLFLTVVLAPFIALALGSIALAQTSVGLTAQAIAPVACTMEAKQCPDGSWVGRTGLSCEFAACPQQSVCPVIDRDLVRGTTHVSVSKLQDFLSAQGYFSGASIGVFGPATLRAVVAFQRANNVPPTGFVGPLTRAVIARRCGVVPPVATAVKIYSMKPVSGPTGTQVTIDGFGFTADNTVHFGTGVIVHVPLSGQIAVACTTDPSCIGGIHQTLVFTVPEALNPACFYSNPRCLVLTRQTTPGDYTVSVENTNGASNTKTFTVTGVTATNSPRIDTITPSSGSLGQTVTLSGTGFTQGMVLRFAEGSVAHSVSADGASVTFVVPESVGPYCLPNMMCAMYMRRITPGTYDVYVQNTDGSSISNKVSFTVTDASSGNPLAISGLDAPTSIPLGTNGTWTVHVSSGSQFAYLSYSVVWGDEMAFADASGIMAPRQSTLQTSATFTHSYQRSGTYTPVFTVTDSAGHSATVSASIVVTPLY